MPELTRREAAAIVIARMKISGDEASDLIAEAIHNGALLTRNPLRDEINENYSHRSQANEMGERGTELPWTAFWSVADVWDQDRIDTDAFRIWLARLDVSGVDPLEIDLQTGLPGAPEKGRTAIIGEFNRRLAAGETLAKVSLESRALISWFAKSHPKAQRPTPKTTENLIREAFRNRTMIKA
jgi:hypothetical protein